MSLHSVNKFLKQWVLPPAVNDLLQNVKGGLEYRLSLSSQDRTLLSRGEALEDRHIGKRCFVLGAGSSVSAQDLTKLEGEFVISVSNTFVHPEFLRIRPQYHVTPAILQGHGAIYELDRFVNWLREMESASGLAEMIFHIGDRPWIEKHGLFRERQIHWVRYTTVSNLSNCKINLIKLPYIHSVSEIAITLAVYMGFEKIYLLGFDHDWFNGPMVYFYDHKTQHAMQPDHKNFEWVDSEFQMRRHAEIFKKYKYLNSIKNNIFNANANASSYLDIFPKVDYQSLFN
jgi:hypothetical protein